MTNRTSHARSGVLSALRRIVSGGSRGLACNAATLAAAVFFTATPSFAQTSWFWRNDYGAGNPFWGATDRWFAGGNQTLTGVDQNIFLSFDGGQNTTSTNNVTGAGVRGIVFFNSGASRTLDGNQLKVSIGGTGKIENNSGNTQTINLTLSNSTANGLEINPVNGLLNLNAVHLGTNFTDLFGNNTVDFRGQVSGSASFNLKAASGTVTARFSASNSMTGPINIERGFVILNATNATAGTGTINIGASGSGNSAEFQLGTTAALSNSVVNNLNIVNSSGAGATRSIASVNTSGTNTVTGTLANTNSGFVAKLYQANGGTLRFSNVISGAGGFFLENASGSGGTVELSANNTFSGGFFIDNGTLKITDSAASAGSGTIGLGQAGSASNAILRLSGATGGITLANSSIDVRSGSGQRQIISENTSGVNSFNGGLTTTNNLTFDVAAGGTLRMAGAITNNTTVTNVKSGGGTLIYAAATTGGTDNQLKIGNGAVVLGVNNAGTTNTGTTTRAIDLGLDGANTSTANNVALYASNGVTVSNSIYVAPNTSGATRTIGAADSGATVTYNNQIFMAGTARLEAGAGSTVTFSGNLTNGSGTNALEKIGSGIVVLSASNNHAGTNVVTAGSLRLGNNRAAGNATNVVSVASGAALELSNNISTANPVTLNGSGVGGNGALRNVSGNNTNAGAITLGAASRINSDSGTLTLSGGITGTGQSLTVGGAADTVVSGTGINTSTAGTLTKDGNGVLTITASGNYTGGTTLSAGTLRGGHDSAFGTGAVLLNGGTIASDSATARNFSNSLTLGGDVTFGQGSGGTGALTFSSTATNNLGGATRTLTTVVDTKIDGALGNGGITKAGAGTLYLSNASSSFGTLTINAGRVTFQTNAAITGLGGSGGSLQIAGGTLTVNLATNATYTDSISGSGSLAKTGTGTLTLGVANTFAGGSTLSDGVLRVSDTSGLGTGSLVQTSGASTVQFSNAGTVANHMSVYNVAFLTGGNNLSGRITNNNATYDVAAGTTNTISGYMTGPGGLVKTGEGVLSVTGATNDYSSATTISNGTLRVSTLANAGAVSSIGTNAAVNFSGTNASTTVLDYTGGNVTADRNLAFNGVATNNEGGTLRISNSSTVVTLTGSAAGTGRMVVDGGTLVLSNTSASNSFAPASIQVNSNSTLQLAANEQIGNTTGLILNGGTLRLFNGATGFAETLGTLTLTASSVIDLGAATTSRNITFADSSAITWTGTLTITNWQGVALTSGEAGRLLFGSGGLTSTQLSQVYWAGPSPTGSGGALIGINGELVPIPEPRVYAAAVALLAAVGWRERRRILSFLGRGPAPRA